MLLISMGMHGLLLMMPIPSESKHQLSKKEEKVKISQLPTSSTLPAPKPTPSLSLQPSPKPSPKPNQPIPRPTTPVIRQPPLKRLVYREPGLPKPRLAPKPQTQLTPTPTPTPQAQPPLASTLTPQAQPPVASTLTPQAQSTSTSTASPQAQSTLTPVTPTTPTPSASATPVDPFADFPKYSSAQPGSLGLFPGELDKASQQTKDEISPVASYFQQELAARGYQLQPDLDEANQKVYMVSKNGTTKYLNLFFKSGQGTVMVLASERLNPGNLEDVGVASREETAFYGIVGQVSSETVDQPELFFKNPNAFYAKLGPDEKGFDVAEPQPGIDGSFKLIPNQTPDQLFNNAFASNLQSSGFQAAAPSQYGGGPIYEVKQGAFVRYINLVPTKDGTGTIVVVWNRSPS